MLGNIHILGPQMPNPNVGDALAKFCPTGNVAVISAGWRYDEGEIQALQNHIKRNVFHIPLYDWFDQLGSVEPELSGLHKKRQKYILATKKAYHIQLQSSLDSWMQIRDLHRKYPDTYDFEEKEACKYVQNVDARCIQRLFEIRRDFSSIMQPWLHESAQPLYEEIANKLAHSSALLIAGGHVAVLRNRLVFFGLEELLQDFLQDGKQIFAWSAGAMCLTDRIVLYHDDPPWGKGYAEILDSGLGILPNTVFLPHASSRLNLSDPDRIERFARRFAPNVCACLENGAHLLFTPDGVEDLSAKRSAFQLSVDGTKLALENV